MSKNVTVLAICFALLFILISCSTERESLSQEDYTTETEMPPMTSDYDAEAEKSYVNTNTEFDEKSKQDIADTINALMQFSQNLFREILTTGEENILASPLSVYYVLAMAALGAMDNTLYEFKTVLGLSPHELAPQLTTIARNLTNATEDTHINIGGSVWVCDEHTVNADFRQNMIDYFNADVYSRDFLSPLTIDEINKWVYEQTNGFIENALDEMRDDEIMLLINTVYLFARWSYDFNPLHEEIDTFYLQSGEEIEIPFLSTHHISLAVLVTDYYEAAFLPYNDERTGFFLVRPTDRTDIREFITTHDFMQILSRLERRHEVKVAMPALEKEFAIDVNEHLIALGLYSAFDANSANFSELIESRYAMYISRVQQNTRISVGRDGTEAAAVTTLFFPLEALHEPIELRFNTPYFYAVYDVKTGVVLFMGIVDNPSH